MMLFLALAYIGLPILGVLWFLNLIKFFERLHAGRNTHNEKVLGGFLTFVFIAIMMICISLFPEMN